MFIILYSFLRDAGEGLQVHKVRAKLDVELLNCKRYRYLFRVNPDLTEDLSEASSKPGRVFRVLELQNQCNAGGK